MLTLAGRPGKQRRQPWMGLAGVSGLGGGVFWARRWGDKEARVHLSALSLLGLQQACCSCQGPLVPAPTYIYKGGWAQVALQAVT
jgi:hypothetical protein